MEEEQYLKLLGFYKRGMSGTLDPEKIKEEILQTTIAIDKAFVEDTAPAPLEKYCTELEYLLYNYFE